MGRCTDHLCSGFFVFMKADSLPWFSSPPEANCDHEDLEAYCRLGRRRRKQSEIIPFAVSVLGRPVLLSAHRSGSGLIYPSIPA